MTHCKGDLLAYLRTYNRKRTMIADLRSDALADDEFPLGAHTLDHYLSYLDSLHACDEAVGACKTAFRNMKTRPSTERNKRK